MDQSQEYELDIDEMEHRKRIMEKLNIVRSNEANCDFIISVGDRTICVNKDIVRAGSDYFDAMLSHDTTEKQHGIVQLKGVEYFAVEKCVDFIYTGKLSVSMQQCDDVLFVANIMQLNEIRSKIILFLQSHMDIETFFDVRRIALKYSLTQLEEFCHQFAVSEVIALSKVEEFNEAIDACYLSLLISSKVSATSEMEDAKLAIVVQWVNAKQDDRIPTLVALLDSIDFSNLTPEYCMYLVNEEPLCQLSIYFVRMLFSAVAPKDKISCIKPLEIPPDDKPMANALIVFDDDMEEVTAYFPSEVSCKSIADYDPSLLESNFTACSVGTTLYVIQSNRRLLYLDFEEDSDETSWNCGPELRHFHGDVLRCAVHGGSIYVGGGNCLEKLELSDFSEWKNVDLSGNICDSSAMVSYGKSLYLIGGKNTNQYRTKAVVKKSPLTRWKSVSSMHVERNNAVSVVHDGSIYVCDGDDSKHSLERFEVYSNEDDVWTILKNSTFSAAAAPFGLHVADNQIFAITNDCILSYDFGDKSWNEAEGIELRNACWLQTTSFYLPFDTEDVGSEDSQITDS